MLLFILQSLFGLVCMALGLGVFSKILLTFTAQPSSSSATVTASAVLIRASRKTLCMSGLAVAARRSFWSLRWLECEMLEMVKQSSQHCCLSAL